MGIFKTISDSWQEASRQVDEEIRKKNFVKPGSVLRDDRDTYDHYAIYAGRKKVIHFSEGVVKLSSLEEMKGRSWGYVEVMGFDEDKIRDITPHQSLKRARSCLGMTGYDLINNNCEHFAVWCRTGKAFSSQAFGSESTFYVSEEEKALSRLSMNCASGFTLITNVPRLVSNLYKKKIGMNISRTVDIGLIND